MTPRGHPSRTVGRSATLDVMQVAHASRVSEYYDHNTAPFLRWGGSGVHVAAIHRELWAPGVVNSKQAFEYVNRYVLSHVETSRHAALGPTRLVDLGCGIGGTATWLTARCDCHVTGVTLSEVQRDWAVKRATELGLSARCEFRTEDMTATSLTGPFDVAYAIESLIHVEAATRFFREAARLVRPGGKLLVCDDYAAAPGRTGANSAWLDAFETGWRAYGLRTWQQTAEIAEQSGFSVLDHKNVTSHQRVVAPWLVYLGHTLLKLPLLRGPYWDSLRGSTALQHCVRRGWVEYHLTAFTRRE